MDQFAEWEIVRLMLKELKILCSRFIGNSSIKYGIKHEMDAIRKFKSTFKETWELRGLYVDEGYDFFGCQSW